MGEDSAAAARLRLEPVGLQQLAHAGDNDAVKLAASGSHVTLAPSLAGGLARGAAGVLSQLWPSLLRYPSPEKAES